MSQIIHGTFSAGIGVICDCDVIDSSDYCAIPVWTGEHAGMVSLTITGQIQEDCNDTFYGTWNSAMTGWQVTIPDNCCNAIPCGTYSDWSSAITYSTGQRTTAGGFCYESLQNSNINNIPSESPTWWSTVPCECPAGYSAYDCTKCCCFESGKTPLYLCVTFSGIRLCSDDSLVPDFSVCCQNGGGSTEPEKSRWYGSCSLGVVVIDWSEWWASSLVVIYSSEGVYYLGAVGDYCGIPENRITKTQSSTWPYCGNKGYVTVWDECPWTVGKLPIAYGGYGNVYDPNTGEEIQQC